MRLPVLIFLVVILGLTAASGPLSPRCTGGENLPAIEVTGRIEQVYSIEKQVSNTEIDLLYAIELTVTKEAQAEGKLVGTRIFVKTWKAKLRPDGYKGSLGQSEIPARGDLAEFRLTGGPAAFLSSIPDGIKVRLAGSAKSDTTGLELNLIHPGEFQMGSTEKEPNRRNDEFQHLVKITSPYYLGTYEVTQFEYRQVMQARPSAFSIGGSGREKVRKLVTDRFPVDSVSWFDAVEFCNRLSKLDGFEPYYEIAEPMKNGDTIESAVVKIKGGKGYRLPSEAEWEYACRAGTATPFHYGVESALATANVKPPNVAGGYGAMNPKWKELSRTAKVGSYPPNEWGLFDMHGNVEEWCEDWWDKDGYQNGPGVDPHGPPEGVYKVARGGSWLLTDANCRAASRIVHQPREAKFFGGFRVARTP